jgi:hypothetical protein
MIPDEDRGILETGLRSLTADNPKMTIEHRITGPDGGIRWFRWTTRAIFDDQGRPVEYDGIGRDITELHEAAARIRKHPADIKFLSRNAKSLAGIRTCDEIFSVTAKNLRSVIPDAFVGVCTYTPAAKTLVFRCIAGNPDELGIMNHELERDLAGAVFIFDADAEHLALFSSKRLVAGYLRPCSRTPQFREVLPDGTALP